MKRWQSDFDVYEVRLEAHRAMVRLDLAARAHAPVATHPLRMTVGTILRSPHVDGLRTSEEAPALFALEDELIPTLERELDAIFVCAIVARARQRWTFYIPADRQERAEAAVASCESSYPLQTALVADAQWSGYLRFYPAERTMQTIWNRRLVATLKKKGDLSSMERTIDHRAYFPSESTALQATAALQVRGFVAKAPTVTEERGWALDFTRSDACEPPLPDRWTVEILDIVEPLGGEYDGWGCVVVTARLLH
jgi:hypothetical protein